MKAPAATRTTAFATIAALIVTTAISLAGTSSAGAQATPSTDRDSGGKAVAHKAGAIKVKAKKTPKAATYYITRPSGEPTLGSTKNGDIFFSAIQTNTRVDVMRSSDKGKTWEDRSPKLPGGRNAHLLTLDPYVYVDYPTSRVFTIDLTVACSYLSYTDDQGESWTTNPAACGRPVNDHQTLFAGPPVQSPMSVYENIVYYCWNDVASSACSKSLDGGISFSPTGSPAFAGAQTGSEGGGANFCGGLHGHGVVGKDGTVFLPREYCNHPYLAISRDEGATWDQVQVANIGHLGGADPSVAVDKKGNIYYAWIGVDRLPYLTTSRDGGQSWSRPLMIGAPGVKETNLPTIDVGAPGKIAVAYMGSENSPYLPEGQGSPATPETTWNGYIMMTANALSASPTFYTGLANDRKDPIKRGSCGPGRCGTTVYDFIDVVVGPDGSPYAAFVDACTMICTQGGSDSGNEGLLGRLVGGPRLR